MRIHVNLCTRLWGEQGGSVEKDMPGISETSVEYLDILCFISLGHQGLSGIYCTEPKMHLGQTKPFK